MAFPKWLQPIENVFRAVEKWFTLKRFFLVLGIFLVLAGLLSWRILATRHDAGWLKDSKEFDQSGKKREYCGKEIRWDRTTLPVPVWVDASLPNDWDQYIQEGLLAADPWGKLFSFKGRLGLGVDDPEWAITIAQWNKDDHGRETWSVTPAGAFCMMVKSHIDLPVLLLPGKVRTRVVAHELLHAMGLSHSDWETHLMYPVASPRFPFKMSSTERELLETAYIR